MTQTRGTKARSTTRVALGAVLALSLAVPTGVLTAPAATATPAAAQAKAAPAKYKEYYKYFNLGPRAIPMHDTRFAPQGLTNWGENKLIIGYYDADHAYGHRSASRIAIVDRATLKPLKIFTLNTQRHVSGLATTNGYLWVSFDSRLIRYPTSRLSAKSGSKIYADKEFGVKGKASYAFGQGENIWTGTSDQHHRSTMYRYSISHGKPTLRESRPTPSNVQGVAVTSNRILWSSSFGTADSRLIVWPRYTNYNGSTKIGRAVIAPPRTEGVAIANNHLQIVFESGANKYNKTTEPVIRSIHHGTMPSLQG